MWASAVGMWLSVPVVMMLGIDPTITIGMALGITIHTLFLSLFD